MINFVELYILVMIIFNNITILSENVSSATNYPCIATSQPITNTVVTLTPPPPPHRTVL